MPTGVPRRVGTPSTARIGSSRSSTRSSGQRGSTSEIVGPHLGVEDERVDAGALSRTPRARARVVARHRRSRRRSAASGRPRRSASARRPSPRTPCRAPWMTRSMPACTSTSSPSGAWRSPRLRASASSSMCGALAHARNATLPSACPTHAVSKRRGRDPRRTRFLEQRSSAVAVRNQAVVVCDGEWDISRRDEFSRLGAEALAASRDCCCSISAARHSPRRRSSARSAHSRSEAARRGVLVAVLCEGGHRAARLRAQPSE